MKNILVSIAIIIHNILNILPTVLVKNVKVLKDGGSAVYGSHGVNGILIIETKNASDQ